MRHTHIGALVAITVGFSISGCGGKPEITSKCDVKGSGEFLCTYTNKGTAKGSVCGHLAIADDAFNHPILLRYQKAANLVTERFGYKFNDSDMAVGRNAYGAGKDLATYVAENPRKDAPYMQVAMTPEYAEADKKIKAILAKLPQFNASQLSDHEICSGIVEAGDIKQVTGTVSFKGKRPIQICSLSFSRCNIQPVPSATKQNALEDEKLLDTLKPLVAALPYK